MLQSAKQARPIIKHHPTTSDLRGHLLGVQSRLPSSTDTNKSGIFTHSSATLDWTLVDKVCNSHMLMKPFLHKVKRMSTYLVN